MDNAVVADIFERIDARGLTPDRALEVHRVVDANAGILPRSFTSEIYGRIRPSLRIYAPPRRLDGRRLFCIPFEDLLVNQDPEDKIRRRIARASIEPVWRMVADALGPARLADLELDAGLVTQNACEADGGVGERWWLVLAETLRGVADRLSNDRQFRQKAAGALDKTARLADLREMAEALENWEAIRIVRETIPAGTRDIPEAGLPQVAGIVNECVGLASSDIVCDVAIARIRDDETRIRLSRLLDDGRDRAIECAADSLVERLGAIRRSGEWAALADAIAAAFDRANAPKSRKFDEAAARVGDAAFSVFLDGIQQETMAGWIRLMRSALKAAVFDTKGAQQVRDFLSRTQSDIEAKIAETRGSPRQGDALYFELVRCIEEIAGTAAANRILIRDGLRDDPEDPRVQQQQRRRA